MNTQKQLFYKTITRVVTLLLFAVFSVTIFNPFITVVGANAQEDKPTAVHSMQNMSPHTTDNQSILSHTTSMQLCISLCQTTETQQTVKHIQQRENEDEHPEYEELQEEHTYCTVNEPKLYGQLLNKRIHKIPLYLEYCSLIL